MSKHELALLKRDLRGPILKIDNPRKFDKEDILKSYFREILVIARKYTRPSVEFEDLVVEGLMGLLDAIDRWDPEKADNNPDNFRNLAIVRIKSCMFEYFLANYTRYKIPNYMGRAWALVDQARSLFEQTDFPGDAEAALLNFEAPEFEAYAPVTFVKRLHRLKEKIQTLGKHTERSYEQIVKTVLSVEREIANYERSEKEELEVSPEEIIAQKEFLEKFLGNLTPQARHVIEGRLEGKTLEDVGREMDVTREWVRQLEKDALDFFHRTRMCKDALSD